MRRLFVPSVVLLVLSVVMMVGSWCLLAYHPRSGTMFFSFSSGCVWWVIADTNWTHQGGFTTHGFLGVELTLLPRPFRPAGLAATALNLPTWYFVAASALVLACSWRPWLEARRRRGPNTCPACGYDLSGGQSVCPECGKAKAAAGASATPSQ